jgi:hypothetical protein
MHDPDGTAEPQATGFPVFTVALGDNFLPAGAGQSVGCQNSATILDQGFYAARWY